MGKIKTTKVVAAYKLNIGPEFDVIELIDGRIIVLEPYDNDPYEYSSKHEFTECLKLKEDNKSLESWNESGGYQEEMEE